MITSIEKAIYNGHAMRATGLRNWQVCNICHSQVYFPANTGNVHGAAAWVKCASTIEGSDRLVK